MCIIYVSCLERDSYCYDSDELFLSYLRITREVEHRRLICKIHLEISIDTKRMQIFQLPAAEISKFLVGKIRG